MFSRMKRHIYSAADNVTCDISYGINIIGRQYHSVIVFKQCLFYPQMLGKLLDISAYHGILLHRKISRREKTIGKYLIKNTAVQPCRRILSFFIYTFIPEVHFLMQASLAQNFVLQRIHAISSVTEKEYSADVHLPGTA